tara:strand:+ start:581 stop:790 length:210 start_codon:yes stop_codon:yes gene_type:complete
MILDTHKFVENLVAAGFKKKQAEVFVQEINDNHKELATKEDLKIIERDLIWIKGFLFLIFGGIISLWFR